MTRSILKEIFCGPQQWRYKINQKNIANAQAAIALCQLNVSIQASDEHDLWVSFAGNLTDPQLALLNQHGVVVIIP